VTEDRPSSVRTIAVLTTGRQDWGILRSTCVAIRATPTLRLRLLVGGMHLSARHGDTVRLLRDDGFAPDAELPWLDDRSDEPMSAERQAAAALQSVGAELAAHRPAALVLAGDRLETAAAALAATITRVPIVHIHGGEQTEGAFDDALRHAITKLSHLHLVSEPDHAARVAALGEDPATVHVIGAPGLDNAVRPDLPDRVALATDLGLALEPPVVVVTVQPATLEPDPAGLVEAVVQAMDAVPATYVVTLPNTDPEAERIRSALVAAVGRDPRRVAVEALGERRYWGLLRIADAMLGNSSSGLVEAPAVDLPVINVGDRQQGRHRDANVIDVPAELGAVTDALRRALNPATRSAMAARRTSVADGRAGERIARIIAAWQPPDPPRKAPIIVRREP
jgi:UDP-hydrolysing UDP-N-acetyl-D-glucosamine 2-epimerase